MYSYPIYNKKSCEVCSTKKQNNREHGFALVIALSLMAFVLLLILSITTFVQVETQSSAISKNTLEARSNAMLGLSIALGELQKYAGADQRVTTTATVTTNFNDNSQDGTRYWTGVWGNTNGPNAATCAPILLNWLVSGNQGQTLTVANDGSVTVPSGGAMEYAPNAAVVINGSEATINNQSGAVLLGAGSVDQEADYVVAPIISINSATGGGQAGGYAFWVGDEGVKANIGLVKGPELALDADSSSYGEAAVRRIQANQSIKTGGELIQVGPNDTTLWGADFDLTSPSFLGGLGKLTDFTGLELMGSVPQPLTENRLHDLTFVSQGLQTNTLQGGLKADLSLAFELPEAEFDSTEMIQNSDNGHVVRHQGVYGPKWKLLRDYYRLYQSVENTTGSPLLETHLVTPLPSEDPDLGIPYLFGEADSDILSTGKTSNQTIQGYPNAHNLPPKVRDAIFPEKMKLAPVVADIKYLISVDAELLGSTELTPIGSGGNTIQADRKMRLVFDPIVKLWNPYNVRLKFDAFTIRTSHLPIGLIWDVNYPTTTMGSGETYIAPQTNLRKLFNEYYGGGFGSWANWLDSIVVSIGDPNGIVLEPGEVKIFSSGESAPVPFVREMDLVEGWEDRGGYRLDGIDPSNSATDARMMATADTEFAVTMTTKAPESGWKFYMISTYLFSEGEYDQRHNVKESGASNFYNTAYYRINSRDLPFSGFGVSAADTLRSPSGGQRWPLPTLGEKQYLLAIEMSLKAEDELDFPVPFAQFSPTAYVHSYEQNSVNSLRVGPASTVKYRKINNQADADIQYDTGSNQAYFGSSHGTIGQTHVPILDIPQAPLFSLGQLQNADTSIYAVDPLLAVGNSFGSPLLAANLLNGVVDGRSRLDMPYLLNRTLWDDYFFSTIAPQQSDLFAVKRDIEAVFDGMLNDGEVALNPNIKAFNLSGFDAKANLFDGDQILPQAPQRSAAFLLQNGQFNLNSTSVEAWRGLLGSSLGGLIPYVDRDSGLLNLTTETDAPISRFSLPLTSGDASNYWEGYRSLTPAELNTMATAVVDEIREHGPFLSLSDFVNRDYSNGSERGLLDRAIEAADINGDYYETVAQGDVGYLPASARENVEGLRGQGAAKFLLQSDVLSLLGQRLSTRSDTFRIRTYGEVVDPISNQVQASAWVEAIVQRMPEYIDDQADAPWDQSTGDNINFGRRFVIKSVRFISKEDV